MGTISRLFYGLAFAVLAYNFFLKCLSWQDGKFRSWVFAVATIFGLLATVAGEGNWGVFFAIVAVDWLPPFFLGKRRR